MSCDKCRWFNKNGFALGTGDCVLHRRVCGSGHNICEQYEEYEPRPQNIIHCKDCEYFRTPEKYSYKEPNPYCCRSALVKMSENDFCSKAKKRGEKE